MTLPRPSIVKVTNQLDYGDLHSLVVTLPAGTKASDVSVVAMEYGYHTHALGFNQRLVKLVVKSVSSDGKTIKFYGPPSATIFPPGVAWLHVLAGDVPSVGHRVVIGDGSAPPVSTSANANMLSKTKGKECAWEGERRR